MSESENIVTETAARIFADLADPQTVNRAKDGAWKDALWQALADAGLTLAWVPEDQGGAGREPCRTGSRSSASPAGSRRRCRSPRRCSPAGSSRAPGLPRRPAP